MIQANELRVGNWVKHKICWSVRNPNAEHDFYFQWEDTDFYRVHECTLSYEDIEPILLTPEILEKCGFKNNFYRPTVFEYQVGEPYEDKSINITFHFNRIEVFQCFGGDNGATITLPACKHLHTLQNLIFALTGTELQINL